MEEILKKTTFFKKRLAFFGELDYNTTSDFFVPVDSRSTISPATSVLGRIFRLERRSFHSRQFMSLTPEQ